MAGVTPIYSLPYQELGDPPSGPTLGEDLAESVETELARIDSDISTIGPLQAPYGKIARTLANQSIPHNALTTVQLDTLVESSGVTVDTVGRRLVIVTPGVYCVHAIMRWENSGSGDGVCRILLNSAGQGQETGVMHSTTEGGLTLAVTLDIRCNTNDALTMAAYQDSGGAVNITTNFGGTNLSAHWFRS